MHTFLTRLSFLGCHFVKRSSLRRLSSTSAKHSMSEIPVVVCIHGKWYDVSNFQHEHPGGKRLLSAFHGCDASVVFDKCMHSKRATALMIELLLADNDARCPVDPPKAHNALTWEEQQRIQTSPTHDAKTLFEYALLILNTHDSFVKAQLTLEAYGKFYPLSQRALKVNVDAKLSSSSSSEYLTVADLIPTDAYADVNEWLKQPENAVPDEPRRDKHLKKLDRKEMTPANVKGDPKGNRMRLIHAQAHIESYAIDLSWDILLRFAGENVPMEFYLDWLRVAHDEAKHFQIWFYRLLDLEGYYGCEPTHDGLWESAQCTSDDVCARLAVVHMVHEARGLDMAKRLQQRMEGAGDNKSATFLREIEEDEIDHVAYGVKWFKYFTQMKASRNSSTTAADANILAVETFQALVRERFEGFLIPPFNVDARRRAGLEPHWYEPLADPKALQDWKHKLTRIAEKKQQIEARRVAKQEASEAKAKFYKEKQHNQQQEEKKAKKKEKRLGLSDAEYWDSFFRYKSVQEDWYLPNELTMELIAEHSTVVREEAETSAALHVGAGSSELSFALASLFPRVVNVDFSPVVIQQMQTQWEERKRGVSTDGHDEATTTHSDAVVEFVTADMVTGLPSVSNGSIGLVLDKGLLDCVALGDESVEAVRAMLAEANRVLCPKGVYLIFSVNGERETLFQHAGSTNLDWNMTHIRVPFQPAENPQDEFTHLYKFTKHA